MDFSLSSDISIQKYDYYYECNAFKFTCEFNNRIKEREFFYESKDFLIAADANISFIDNLIQSKKDPNSIENLISALVNGFVIIIDKRNNFFTLYNDIFGFYHLFVLKNKRNILISSLYYKALEYSNRQTDYYAIIDIILFNYTLIDRTLTSDIKRLVGGSKVIVGDKLLNASSIFNFANNFKIKDTNERLSSFKYGLAIKKALEENLSPNSQTSLSMTAGFDSRALLAACINLGIDYSTFTFGQNGNIENETIMPFIGEYSSKHTFHQLNEDFTFNLGDTLQHFINLTLDNPCILDLPHYYYIRDKIATSNVIFGYMGGEMLIGQSIGAQVTFTSFSGALLNSNNDGHFSELVYNFFMNSRFLNEMGLSDHTGGYANTLIPYFIEKDNLNILRFLINEKYAKFFGTINNIYRNHHNIIVPFMDKQVLELVLNSNISFLRKKPFKNNPIINFRAKRLYAKAIKGLAPELAKTRFDRLYTVNDLCKIHRIPIAAFGYLQSHLFKVNKKYVKPHDYDLWFKSIIMSELASHSIGSGMFSKAKFGSSDYDNLSSPEKKCLAKLAALSIALKNTNNILM